ncbi:unnamed protein product [Clavelina lepadiformis]|uniref:Uncharacterized protein n=1 Tax=Clavelina lepadiformis TaxID=159417 RepID=A0ABP0H3A3_CLALP
MAMKSYRCGKCIADGSLLFSAALVQNMRSLMSAIFCIFLAQNRVSYTCEVTAYAAFCSSANLTSVPKELDKVGLRVIDLSDNLLTSLSSDEIIRKSRITLQQLTLRNNRFSQIPASTIGGMFFLYDLDLSWNNIDHVVAKADFDEVVNLDYLSLAHNEIPCFQADAFKGLTKLTELDISHNNLTAAEKRNTSCLPRECLCRLKSLIVLRISSNYVPEIFKEDGFFSCLPLLTNLQAANCGIEVLAEHAFAGLEHLSSLDLSDNSIVSWPSELLRHAKSLVYLDLGHNLISNLPGDFTRQCVDLCHLSLRNNELRTPDVIDQTNDTTITIIERYLTGSLKVKAMTNVAKDLYIDWSGNPWLCDCKILDFVDWILTQGSWLADAKGYHDVICYNPAYHRGSALFDVYVTGLIDRVTANMLFLQCRVDDDDPKTIHITAPATTYGSQHHNITTMPVTSTNVSVVTMATSTNELMNVSSVTNATHAGFEYLVEDNGGFYVLFIILAVVADIVISVGLIFVAKKCCLRQENWASVAPAPLPQTSVFVSNGNRVSDEV